MSIQDLIDEAKAQDCNVGIIVVKTEKDSYAMELRISKDRYHISRTILPEDISLARIDIVATEFNIMLEKIEEALTNK